MACTCSQSNAADTEHEAVWMEANRPPSSWANQLNGSSLCDAKQQSIWKCQIGSYFCSPPELAQRYLSRQPVFKVCGFSSSIHVLSLGILDVCLHSREDSKAGTAGISGKAGIVGKAETLGCLLPLRVILQEPTCLAARESKADAIAVQRVYNQSRHRQPRDFIAAEGVRIRFEH